MEHQRNPSAEFITDLQCVNTDSASTLATGSRECTASRGQNVGESDFWHAAYSR